MKELIVTGMHCPHCQKAVHEAITNLEGVQHCEVDLASGKVRYEETSPVSPQSLRDAVEAIGFAVKQ